MMLYHVPFDHIDRHWTYSDLVGLIAVANEEPKKQKSGLTLRQLIGR